MGAACDRENNTPQDVDIEVRRKSVKAIPAEEKDGLLGDDIERKVQDNKVKAIPAEQKYIVLESAMETKVLKDVVERTVERMEKSWRKSQMERAQNEEKFRAQISESFERLIKEISAKSANVECLFGKKLSELEESFTRSKAEIKISLDELNDSVSKISKDCKERTNKTTQEFSSLKTFTSYELARYQTQHCSNTISRSSTCSRSRKYIKPRKSSPSVSASAASDMTTSGGGTFQFPLWFRHGTAVK